MQEVGSRMLATALIALCLPLLLEGGSEQARSAWLVAVLAVALVSYLVVSYYHRHQVREAPKAGKWHGLNLGLALLWGGLWCAMPYVFFTESSVQDMLLLVLIMTIIAGTPSVSTSSYPDFFHAFLLPVFGSLTYFLNSYAAHESWLLRYIPLVPMTTLSLFSIYSHKAHMENIHLRLAAEQASEKIQQANDSKAGFLAAVSHDLRQPLQAANLYADLLKQGGIDQATRSPEQAQRDAVLAKLMQSLNACDQLVDRLLALSRLQNNALVARPEVLSLRDKLAAVIDANLPMAKQKGLGLKLSGGLDSVLLQTKVYADPVFVMQILNNYLANAIKYSNEGEVELALARHQEGLVLTVSDSGPGIAKAQQAEVFKEFFQLDNDYLTREQGLGIGLAIVKQLCELAGYRYFVESELGRGSTFGLVLPRYESASSC